MPDDRKRQTLSPERLREVLARLNEVLAEAERLRGEVTRQIEAQQHGQRQHVGTVKGTRARPARRSSR